MNKKIQSAVHKIKSLCIKIFQKLGAIERKYRRIISFLVVVGGITRIEIIEYTARSREKELIKQVKECSSEISKYQSLVITYDSLKKHLDNEKQERNRLELELDSYKLAIIMYMGGKIDTALVKKTINNYE